LNTSRYLVINFLASHQQITFFLLGYIFGAASNLGIYTLCNGQTEALWKGEQNFRSAPSPAFHFHELRERDLKLYKISLQS
jgi:hypothetical protein